MSQEDVRNAIDNVNNFINNAKEIMSRRMEEALREIAKLEPNESYKSKDIAEKALGIGKYWNT